MPVTDIDYAGWSTARDSNSPNRRTTIQQLLDDEPRNIRGNVRRLWTPPYTAWVRPGLAATKVDTRSFTLEDDQRTVASVGRSVWVTTGTRELYGRIMESTFGSGLTTVSVAWRPDIYSDTKYAATTDDVIATFTPLRGVLVAGDVVEFCTASGIRRIRKVASVAPTTATFETGDPYKSDLLTLEPDTPSVIRVPSTGIDSAITEFRLGMIGSELFQSGWPNNFLAGAFDLILDGVHTSFTIALPVALNDANFKVQITPVGKVTGVPSGTQYAKIAQPSRTYKDFTVGISVAVSGATVRYFYFIQRQQ